MYDTNNANDPLENEMNPLKLPSSPVSNNFTHIRYQRLVEVCERALHQVLKNLQDFTKVRYCYPNYAITHQQDLINCQQQIVELWYQLCSNEFREIFQERQLEQKLNELDDLIEVAKKKKYEYLAQEEVEEEKDAKERYNNNNKEVHTFHDKNLSFDAKKSEQLEDISKITPKEIVNFYKFQANKKLIKNLKEKLDNLTQNNKQMLQEINDCFKRIDDNIQSINDEVYVNKFGDQTNRTISINVLRSNLTTLLNDLNNECE
ncbi:uncharacterized protein SCODWIG_02856 [Saccharomycodes ludwigii]|uniref:Kinetochore-associated protein n=1 Tax=Saccharomycodes ludwigii TaxID=36035 RepID=A0A376B8U9_9ASCO|nr:uncharacterized protein SCODWIG_02856 [Saccharomycodes ludwigii]